MMATKPMSTVETQDAAAKTESKPLGAVEDLERRLASLGGGVATTPGAVLTDVEEDVSFAKPPAAGTEANASVKGGKNALLARIMAAQEKAKQAGAKQEPMKPAAAPAPELPPPSFDVFSQSTNPAPPPAFDEAQLPPPQQHQQAPPPSFASVENTVMQQVKPPVPAAPVVVPSAPDFDLLDPQSSAPPAAAPLGGFDMVAPPAPAPPAPAPEPTVSPEEEVIMGMEGLSPEERRALIEEQRRIMEQIEKDKSNAATSAADAFEMRSNTYVAQVAGGGTTSRMPVSSSGASAANAPGTETGQKVDLGGGQEVALHGPERTKAAIADGTAVLVQCVNCQNWMQVTGSATLMYCPVCAVVSPVDQTSAAKSKEEALQMTADQQLAEKLQNEEYARGAGGGTRRAPERPATRSAPSAGGGTSMWDTFTSMFSTTETSGPPQPQVQDTTGVTRPPGASRPSTESIDFARNPTRSYDEDEGLLGQGGSPRRAPARVAQGNSNLFSCVADGAVNALASVGTALNSTTLNSDGEGNVHGVDSSSLLSMSNVSRNPTTSYSALPPDA